LAGAYRHGVGPGVIRFGWVRLAEVCRAYPQVQVCCVEGTWHAWIPHPAGGREVGGDTLDDLLDRLLAALAG
jgi:hypothetical protein